jgi:hypothetical protein
VDFTRCFCLTAPPALHFTVAFGADACGGMNHSEESDTEEIARKWSPTQGPCPNTSLWSVNKNIMELLCLSQGTGNKEYRFLWEWDTNKIDPNFRCLDWDLARIVTPVSIVLLMAESLVLAMELNSERPDSGLGNSVTGRTPSKDQDLYPPSW